MFHIVYICMLVTCIKYISQSKIHIIIILMNNTNILFWNNSWRWTKHALQEEWKNYSNNNRTGSREAENTILLFTELNRKTPRLSQNASRLTWHEFSRTSIRCCVKHEPEQTITLTKCTNVDMDNGMRTNPDWLIEHGFTSAPTQYRLYGRQTHTGITCIQLQREQKTSEI